MISEKPVPSIRMPDQQLGSPDSAHQLTFLKARQLRFFKTGATLGLSINNAYSHPKVSIKKAFPLSLPSSYFSVRSSDDKEIGVIVNLDELDAASRQLVEEELRRRYLVPVIERVLRLTARFGSVDWEVETNRGSCAFTTRDLRAKAVRISEQHYLLRDTENNLFAVPDITKLDRQSQAWLKRYL